MRTYDLTIKCHNIPLTRENKENYFSALLKPVLKRIMRINGVSQELIDSKIDSFPLFILTNMIYSSHRIDHVLGPRCIVTPSEFRRTIELFINNITRTGEWILFEDREHEPLHSIVYEDYERAANQLWAYACDMPEERNNFLSYEDMSNYYTQRENMPDYDKMYNELTDALDDTFEAIDVQASIQFQLDNKSRTLFICNGLMRCEQEHHKIISVRLSMQTLSKC